MAVDPKLFARDPNGQIRKGSGGRVAGTRNKLSHAFLSDAIEAWAEHGKERSQDSFPRKA